MKSSYRDHLKGKYKPTLFGIFETQVDAMLKIVYAYIYNETVYSPPGITCRGPVSGSYRNVTLAEIQRDFDGYNRNSKLQAELLARVEQYVVDFAAATVIKPTQMQMERLLAVRDYFRDNIEPIREDSYTPNEDYKNFLS